MSGSSELTRVWARQLLALEAPSPSGLEAGIYQAERVCEKLRTSLTQLVGPDGFSALMRRALALARADAPSLNAVKAGSDGRLEGIQALAIDEDAGVEAATAIAAHFLGLLVTFIGAPLTLRLVRDIWPEASLEEEP